jgi:hypothetical protein
MNSTPLENKAIDFGVRKFIITDRTVNAMIRLVDRLDGEEKEHAIEVLKQMQETLA